MYNSNEQKLEEQKEEYQNILKRLDKLELEGKIGAFDKRYYGDKTACRDSEGVKRSADILSKDLILEIRVETDLHEWLADGISYEFLSDEMAEAAYGSLTKNRYFQTRK